MTNEVTEQKKVVKPDTAKIEKARAEREARNSRPLTFKLRDVWPVHKG